MGVAATALVPLLLDGDQTSGRCYLRPRRRRQAPGYPMGAEGQLFVKCWSEAPYRGLESGRKCWE